MLSGDVWLTEEKCCSVWLPVALLRCRAHVKIACLAALPPYQEKSTVSLAVSFASVRELFRDKVVQLEVSLYACVYISPSDECGGGIVA